MSPATWQSLVLLQFQRIHQTFRARLDGLDTMALDARPSGLANSIGWTAWHLTRGIDRNVAELAGCPQRWVEAGWASAWGRPADPADTGFGHSAEEATGFRSAAPEVLLAYHDTVQHMVGEYLGAAPAADLGRIAPSPTLGTTHTVEQRLVGLLADSFLHLGQLSVLTAWSRTG
jgi:hypothetical protein